MSKIRVRFAPSPTGALHIGGLRTALYNYLFAKKNRGTFIVRIEDTDAKRYVPEAEQYIFDCLAWCHIEPDESINHKGNFAPYRQSDRKHIYLKYVKQLLESNKAYLAFETTEQLQSLKENDADFKYNYRHRDKLNNSLNLATEETLNIFQSSDKPFVVRLKVEPEKTIILDDMVKGKVSFHTSELDDKIIFKEDKLPTYHLAVVIDDSLMEISHVFRGEEWLSSFPIHYLIYESLGWLDKLPHFVHLPLILKPDGKGKLSKREAEKLDIPIFPLQWYSKNTAQTSKGYREKGFLNEALLNFLASIGWNDGTEKDIYNLNELIATFDLKGIQHSSSKFDYNRAKWINHQHIIQLKDNNILKNTLEKYLEINEIQNPYSIGVFERIINAVRERCYLTQDVIYETIFFFQPPEYYDTKTIEQLEKKISVKNILEKLSKAFETLQLFDIESLNNKVNHIIEDQNLKKREMFFLLRLICIGEKRGINILEIIHILGKNIFMGRIDLLKKHILN